MGKRYLTDKDTNQTYQLVFKKFSKNKLLKYIKEDMKNSDIKRTSAYKFFDVVAFNLLLDKLGIIDEYMEMYKRKLDKEELKTRGYRYGAMIPEVRKLMVDKIMRLLNSYICQMFPEIDNDYTNYTYETYSLSPLINDKPYYYLLTEDCSNLYINFNFLTTIENPLRDIIDNVLFIRRYVSDNRNNITEFIILNTSSKLSDKIKATNAKNYKDWITEMEYYCDRKLEDTLFKPFSIVLP